jgi:hypothetical protein
MTVRFNSFLLISALLLTVSFPAWAEGAKNAAPPGKESGLQVDQNNDGSVTLDEAKQSADRQFTDFDADKNNKIDRKEFMSKVRVMNRSDQKPDQKMKEAIQKMVNARFDRLDTNKDKFLSKDELEADSVARHKAMDTNGDGKVSREEVAALRDKMQAEMKARQDAAKKAAEGKAGTNTEKKAE